MPVVQTTPSRHGLGMATDVPLGKNDAQTLNVGSTSNKVVFYVGHSSVFSLQLVGSPSGSWAVTLYRSNDGVNPEALDPGVVLSSALKFSPNIDVSGIGYVIAKPTATGTGTVSCVPCSKADRAR